MSRSHKPIDRSISIEELIQLVPASVRYLSEKGIRCILCGEPVWGTLEESVLEKGLSDAELSAIIDELNQMAQNREE